MRYVLTHTGVDDEGNDNKQVLIVSLLFIRLCELTWSHNEQGDM